MLFATVCSSQLLLKSNTQNGIRFNLQKDQKIGMGAFAAKQKPTWTHE